ncbi:MAG: hypothetical protein Q9220_005299 [cf. Caloplaca sp. 1 TL-2023]
MLFSSFLFLIYLLLYCDRANAYSSINIEFVFIHKVAPPEITDPRDPIWAIFRNVPPGECCIPHRAELLHPHEDLDSILYGSTGFSVLRAGQLGFGWGAPSRSSRYEDVRCAGNPLVRVAGPNQLPFDPWDEQGGYITTPPNAVEQDIPALPNEILFAASWIDLRTRFPPSSADIRWLQWQGVKGLIWGSGRWNAASEGVPFPRNRKRDGAGRHLNGWSGRGTAFLQAPVRWRRPDLYVVNGTNYTGVADGVYRAADGRVLNLTEPRVV